MLDREPTTDQSPDTAKVQLCEQISFIRVTNRSLEEGLQEQKWLKDCFITHVHHTMGDSSWKLVGSLEHTEQSTGTSIG